MFAFIIGSQNPVVGKAYAYEISSGSLSIFGDNTKYEWYLFKKQKNGNWRDVTTTPKVGRSVTYTFHEPVLGNEFELRVFETKSGSITGIAPIKKQIAKLDLIPSNSKTAQIDKVVLLNRGSKDVNKANYRDTLIAQAFCTAMFDQEVEFQLWEDDAPRGGHDAVINKNNSHNRIYKAKVNEKGIAEARIPLSGDERILRQIANKYLMKGDKSEGKNHEYYVTASYHGKIQNASKVNVDVANPDYKKEQPKQQTPPKHQSPSVPRPKEPKKPVSQPQKAQPKQNTPKFPATKTSSAPRQADAQARITDAYFVNNSGQKLSKVTVGDKISVRIASSNMKDKHIQYVIWEYDVGSPDKVYQSDKLKLGYDLADMPEITITQDMFKKGVDFKYGDSDNDYQNYFIEVIPLDISADSKKFGVTSDGLMKVEEVKSAASVNENKITVTTNCGEKYCIKKGDKNELIREINIRLAGFGGNVPTDEFTDRTEKMIKQFQRDYMKVPETGKICGNVLRAIDDFGSKYFININEGNCPCKVCSGFGKGLFPEEKNNSKIPEKSRKYEYPGIHRSLLWVEKAIKFYLANQEKELGLRVGKINSGYRCNANNKKHGRSSTNHMGKALDIHIYKLTDQNNTEKNADKVRDLLIKYTNAEYRWKGHNVFALEPSSRNRIGDEYIATTWVHYDVRTFGLEYLKDEYFVKDNNGVNGENIVTLANKLGFKNACLCNNNAANKLNKIEKSITTVPNKYKWSHSEFGNVIAQFESSNDYNKCNKTEKIKIIVKGKTKYKRVVKVVDSVKVVETTIKEIQKKQKDKDLFAVGRYQLIPDTLSSAVSSLKLDINRKLDQDMQDKIFDDYLIKIKRSKIIAYLEKNGNVEDAMYSSAQEWASIGVEKGKRLSDKKTKSGEVIIRYAKGGESYYADDGLNKAHITPEQIKNKLINSKNGNK